MALTPERIDAEAFARWGDMKGAPLAMCRGFARAIEAEAIKAVRADCDVDELTALRKADTELIGQMLDALETCTYESTGAHEQIFNEDSVEAAITAARARLGGGIFAPENAHLFTQEAAAKAFAHVKPLGES